MANAVPAKIGNVNSGSTRDDALFLKVFAGEVITSFESISIFAAGVPSLGENGKT